MQVYQRPDRGNEWWVYIRFRGRRIRRRAPLQNKKGAEAFARRLLRELEDDLVFGRDPFAGPPPSFVDFSERWMRDTVLRANRPSSVFSKQCALRIHLLPTFGRLRLDAITQAELDRFSARLVRMGRSAKTINNLLSMMRCALDAALGWKLIRTLPKFNWQTVPDPTTRYLDESPAAALVAACPPGFWRTFVLFCLRTGARFSEAATLPWAEVHIDVPIPYVRLVSSAYRGRRGPTKTGKLREVPLTTDAMLALKAFPRNSAFVFALLDGSFMQPSSAGYHLRKFGVLAGIQRVSWKDLRHTFGTTLTANSVSLRTVQELMGHEKPETTARYSHVPTKTAAAAVETLVPRALPAPPCPPRVHQAPEATRVRTRIMTKFASTYSKAGP